MPARKKNSPAKPAGSVVDSRNRFEKLLKTSTDSSHYQLRLYVTGNSPRSTEAVVNIRSLCDEFLTDRYTLEVVDIYQQPDKAVDEQVIAAPTLIKELPLPARRLVGNLSDRNKVIQALNLHKEVESPKRIAL